MARIEIDGIDQLMDGLNREGSRMRPRIERALRLSAEALAQALVREEMTTFKRPSGELGALVTADERVSHMPSASYIEVYARGTYTGTRGTPRRAEDVTFVTEYGRGNQKANPWNKRARKKRETQINSIMAQILGGDAYAT